MTVTVTWLQDGGYNASQDRTEQTAMLVKSAPCSVISGILPSDGTDGTVTAQSTPNMTVNASALQAIIADANGGAYVFTSNANTVVPITASSLTNARIDLIICRVYDNAAGDTVATTPLTLPGTAGTAAVQTITGTIEVVTGTPASSPTVPALPNARCIVLGRVSVAAGATTIGAGALSTTGRVGWAVSSGGILPVLNAAALPAHPYPGMPVYRMDTGQTFIWNSTAAAWALVGPTLMNVSIGSNLPAGTPTKEIYGSMVVTVSSSNWNSTFAAQGIPNFTHGYVPLVAAGDNASSLSQVYPVTAACSLSGFGGQCWGISGAVINGAVRINYELIGA